MLKAPNGVKKCTARYRAREIAESMVLSYWMDGIEGGNPDYHDAQAVNAMHKLAALFGAKLVPLDEVAAAPTEESDGWAA